MAAPVQDKYFLKSLHEEIDLFDRKLAHMLKYEIFATDAARTSSASKLQAKRDLLARTARRLVSEGIEFKPSELPRSFRGDEVLPVSVSGAADAASPASSPDASFSDAPSAASPRPVVSHFAGTVLDGQAYVVEAYKRSRSKLSS